MLLCVWVGDWNGWRRRGVAIRGSQLRRRCPHEACCRCCLFGQTDGVGSSRLGAAWGSGAACQDPDSRMALRHILHIISVLRSDHDAHLKVHPARGDNAPGLDAPGLDAQRSLGDEVEQRKKKEREKRVSPGKLPALGKRDWCCDAMRRRRLGVTGEAVCHPSLFGHSRW